MNEDRGRKGRFPSTHWSLVQAAGSSDPATARDALAKLFEAYWYPLFAFVRQRGYTPENAEDLVQDLFCRFLDKNYFDRLKPEDGKFRSYLLGAVKNTMADEVARARAQKRGGGRPPLPFEINFENGERRYLAEPPDPLTPEQAYERRWARALLQRALFRMRRQSMAEERLDEFYCLEGYLPGGPEKVPVKVAATRLGIKPASVRVKVHRLRARYRAMVREEIAHTVSGPDEIEGELAYLLSLLDQES